MKVQFNDEMSCSITQHNRDINSQQGKYVDLKEAPNRVMELPEAKDWQQFGKFIADVNRVPAFRTTGCTAKGKTEGGHEAPFVDIAFDDAELRFCRGPLSDLKQQFEELSGLAVAPALTLEICDSSVWLPSRDELCSIRLWFIGDREQAELGFQPILDLLAEQETKHYLTNAETEIARNREDRTKRRRMEFRFRVFLVIFLTVVAYMLGCTIWATYRLVAWAIS